MTIEEFSNYWKEAYPETYPINHKLKWIYKDRWFRIHSLPKAKRYAESKYEYNIILSRQNQLIEDLIGKGTEVAISFGLYTNDMANNNYKKLTDFGEFQKTLTIDLHEKQSEEYENGTYLDIYAKIEKWQKNNRNDILKAIADDEIRAMFICPSRQCIIAPYDGGVDIIVNSTINRDKLKTRYKEWISKREDGM